MSYSGASSLPCREIIFLNPKKEINIGETRMHNLETLATLSKQDTEDKQDE